MERSQKSSDEINLSLMKSESFSDVKRKIVSKCRELEGIYTESSTAKMQETLARAYFSDMQVDAQTFSQSFLARQLRDDLIPAMYNFVQVGDSKIIETVLQNMSKTKVLNKNHDAAQNWKEYSYSYRNPENKHLKTIRYNLVANFCRREFLEYSLAVTSIDGPSGKCFALYALSNIADIDYEDSDFSIGFERRIFPYTFLDPHGGHYNPNTNFVSLNNRNLLHYSLESKFYLEAGAKENPMLKEVVERNADNNTYYRKLVLMTLCEEVKHGINWIMRRKVNMGNDTEGYCTYAFHRLQESSPLHSLKRIDNKHEVAAAIEEVNAKLTALAFGPDPHLDIVVLFQNTVNEILQKMHSHYHRLLAAMLTDNMQIHQKPTDILELLKLSSSDLRIKALILLCTNFNESFDDLPFCRLSHVGTLYAHSKCHPLFANMAESNKQSICR